MFQSLGKRSTLNPNSLFQPAAKNRKVLAGIDVPLMLTLISLIIFGLIMVHSASWDDSIQVYGSPTVIFQRQVIWAVLGITVAAVITFIDYHHLSKIALPALIITILSLIAVLLFGEERNYAVRTLFRGSIQPSELAKLVTIIYLSVWLYSKRDRLNTITFGLLPLGLILGLIVGWIALQPDYSATLTILFLGGVMFFLAGGERKQIILIVLISIVIGVLVVNVTDTGRQRFQDYTSGWQDIGQSSYHVQRSMESFAKGGIFGIGIGKSDTKLTGLPFPSTDSIFAVVGEETGLLGSALLVGLFAMLLWRGIAIAMSAPDEMGQVLAGGLTIWITFEAFLNMAVMVNLVPFAGNALPFMSAGGSNLVVSLTGMGILMNISRQSAQKREEIWSKFGAVVDLRRWDRRRRVSRPRRSTGIAQD
jgi:cell division protein FtsW